MNDLKESDPWHTTNPPSDANQLKDEGLQPGQSDENRLWITDLRSKERRTSLEIRMGVWTRLELMPGADGEAILYCRYSTGSVDELLTDNVEKSHSYRAWYHTEAQGKYEIWYTMGGSKSNSIQFDVKSGLDKKKATSPLSMATVSGKPIIASFPSISPMFTQSIGLSAGGSKDVSNFRENIENGYLPLPTDITYEGLFYDYYFDAGLAQECKNLFCPSYSYAISKDPFLSESQLYLSIGLGSGIKDFHRRKLNLVVVLDHSGSMSSPFNQYYYDKFDSKPISERANNSVSSKMEIADEAVAGLLGHLANDDRFGLVVFSDDAFVVDPLTPMGDKDRDMLTKRILSINGGGGTNMESGMLRGTELFKTKHVADQHDYDNRIIFLTDAMPNIGETGKSKLRRIIEENLASNIYTTFIGIGVDFNTELTGYIARIRGSNYYSVHSVAEFKDRMDDEFDYMVTPLVFDLQLALESSGYQIEKIYGAPEASEETGQIMKIGTLFPSKAKAGEVRGGVILVKLKKVLPEGKLKLKISYQNLDGLVESIEDNIDIQDKEQDFYQNMGIRKAILLTRYADLLKNWILDERSSQKEERVSPSFFPEVGIRAPIKLGTWERQSVPLKVSERYRRLFRMFDDYFRGEMMTIKDAKLQQEQAVLEKLSNIGQSEVARR